MKSVTKGASNVLGLIILALVGSALVLMFNSAVNVLTAGATVSKVDTADIQSCKFTLHGIIGSEYSRASTPVEFLSVGDVYEPAVYDAMIEYYNLPIATQNEWEIRRNIIRSFPEFQEFGDLYLCYEENCRTADWVQEYVKIKVESTIYETATSCKAKVYGPYRNDEVILYIVEN